MWRLQCNGGISDSVSDTSQKIRVQAVRLLPHLLTHYGQHFVDQICFVKIDTEVCRGSDHGVKEQTCDRCLTMMYNPCHCP